MRASLLPRGSCIKGTLSGLMGPDWKRRRTSEPQASSLLLTTDTEDAGPLLRAGAAGGVHRAVQQRAGHRDAPQARQPVPGRLPRGAVQVHVGCAQLHQPHHPPEVWKANRVGATAACFAL